LAHNLGLKKAGRPASNEYEAALKKANLKLPTNKDGGYYATLTLRQAE
jgi:hypothetical protein